MRCDKGLRSDIEEVGEQIRREHFLLLAADVRVTIQRATLLIADYRMEQKFHRMMRAIKANFNQAQLRNDLGRWAKEGGALQHALETEGQDRAQLVPAQSGFVGWACSNAGRGVWCFYKFSYGIVRVTGPNSSNCILKMPWFGAVHGWLVPDGILR